MKSEPPSRLIPKIYCDLNACGLSDESDDNCYYAFDRKQLIAIGPNTGAKIFVWDWSDSKLIIGCEALLEPFNDFWRARPITDSWYEGLPDETFVG